MNIKLRRNAKPRSHGDSDKNDRITAAEMYQVQESYVRFNQRGPYGLTDGVGRPSQG